MSKPAEKVDVVVAVIDWVALVSLLALSILYLIDGCFSLSSGEFVAVWWCLLSIIRRKDADRLRATLRKSLDSWGECADALRVSIALKQRLILRVVSLKGAVARASKARKADKAKLRRVREIADQMAHNDKVCDMFDAKCHGWVKELLEVTK